MPAAIESPLPMGLRERMDGGVNFQCIFGSSASNNHTASFPFVIMMFLGPQACNPLARSMTSFSVSQESPVVFASSSTLIFTSHGFAARASMSGRF